MLIGAYLSLLVRLAFGGFDSRAALDHSFELIYDACAFLLGS